MFGKKRGTAENVILLDIESSSVGVALAHISGGSAPVLFAESRTSLALPRSLSSARIARQVETAAHEALLRLGLVAARLRDNKSTAHRGIFTKAAVFLAAPWGVPNLAAGKPDFSAPMQQFLKNEIDTLANDLPLSFYTSAGAAAHGITLLHPGGTTLVAILRGEIIELLLIGDEGTLGYATVPVGTRSIYRTLQSHASLSLAEVPSVLSLVQHPTNPYYEPIEAAGRHIIEQVAPAIEALTHQGIPQALVVVAEEPLGSWLAHVLESDLSLPALFAKDATIHIMGATHAAGRLAGHAATPDLHLSLGSLFAQSFMQGEQGGASFSRV